MGIFILDQISTNFGLQIANAYCSIRGSYTVRKRGDQYIISCCAGIWVDKQSYLTNKEMLERPIIHDEILTLSQLDALLKTGVEIYQHIYNGIKAKLGYHNYSDDI